MHNADLKKKKKSHMLKLTIKKQEKIGSTHSVPAWYLSYHL